MIIGKKLRLTDLFKSIISQITISINKPRLPCGVQQHQDPQPKNGHNKTRIGKNNQKTISTLSLEKERKPKSKNSYPKNTRRISQKIGLNKKPFQVL